MRPRNLRPAVAVLISVLALALAAGASGCGTVALGDPPAEVNACRASQTFFVMRVWPEFLNNDYSGVKCSDARCHDASSGRLLRVVPPTSTPTPAIPLMAGSDWDVLYRSAVEQMNCNSVMSSELFTRPAGLRTHGGGRLIMPDGPESVMLAMWLEDNTP